MSDHEEYLRRNLDVARILGATAGARVALIRLRKMKRPPKWLITSFEGIEIRTKEVSMGLAIYRDMADDTPEYIKKRNRSKRLRT